MTDRDDRPEHTTPEDQALIGALRRLWDAISAYPAAMPVLVALGLAILFLLGTRIGQMAYTIFDGDGMAAATFGAILVTFLGAIVSAGVWLDRRKRTRDTDPGTATDNQPDQ